MNPITELKNKIARCITYEKANNLITAFVINNRAKYTSLPENNWERKKYETLVNIADLVDNRREIWAIMYNWELLDGLKCVGIAENDNEVAERDFGIKNFFRLRNFCENMDYDNLILNHNSFIIYLPCRDDLKKYAYFGNDMIINCPVSSIYFYGMDKDGLITDCPYSIQTMKTMLTITEKGNA